eukprot:NODE_1036_length_1085_cov_786.685328_g724_i0.p1 GENE.NODE_1036_length_1085_cov_786.685328_g724_i0~~NODE_1036_length_1085_cov_786.685328_g724_i0.p1  ORF type:complete len:259 (-),score=54.82 NODE_1036_length_1085_cov_786.685328_g724_i0:235-1011(-)
MSIAALVDKLWEQPEAIQFVVLTSASSIGAYYIHNFLLLICHYVSFFDRFKIQPRKYPSKTLIFKAILGGFVVWGFTPLLSYLTYLICKANGMPAVHSPTPAPLTGLIHVVLCLLVTDTSFYWSHRMLHHPKLYKHFHKKHHTFIYSAGVASTYASPVENLFNWAGVTLGPALLATHPKVICIYFALRATETVDAHCGYDLPWSPWRYLSGARPHDFHHSHNVGTYGMFWFTWDRICGTDQAYLKHLATTAAARAKVA